VPALKDIYKNGGTLTWFNHYSVQQAMKHGVDPSRFDAVGLDGQLLRFLLKRGSTASSADIDLPDLIRTQAPTVGLIGGTKKESAMHMESFRKAFPDANILWSFDGFGESTEISATNTIRSKRPDLILVGMGPGKQELEAIRLNTFLSHMPGRTLVATCGGWLDQLGMDNYYTSVAKTLNIRWAFRLFREPKRLWKRYSIFAMSALLHRKEIISYCSEMRSLEIESQQNK
jgi:exopolysaccharide biosynthesis WecB/TagA/CpsF family protein